MWARRSELSMKVQTFFLAAISIDSLFLTVFCTYCELQQSTTIWDDSKLVHSRTQAIILLLTTLGHFGCPSTAETTCHLARVWEEV